MVPVPPENNTDIAFQTFMSYVCSYYADMLGRAISDAFFDVAFGRHRVNQVDLATQLRYAMPVLRKRPSKSLRWKSTCERDVEAVLKGWRALNSTQQRYECQRWRDLGSDHIDRQLHNAMLETVRRYGVRPLDELCRVVMRYELLIAGLNDLENAIAEWDSLRRPEGMIQSLRDKWYRLFAFMLFPVSGDGTVAKPCCLYTYCPLPGSAEPKGKPTSPIATMNGEAYEHFAAYMKEEFEGINCAPYVDDPDGGVRSLCCYAFNDLCSLSSCGDNPAALVLGCRSGLQVQLRTATTPSRMVGMFAVYAPVYDFFKNFLGVKNDGPLRHECGVASNATMRCIGTLRAGETLGPTSLCGLVRKAFRRREANGGTQASKDIVRILSSFGDLPTIVSTERWSPEVKGAFSELQASGFSSQQAGVLARWILEALRSHSGFSKEKVSGAQGVLVGNSATNIQWTGRGDVEAFLALRAKGQSGSAGGSGRSGNSVEPVMWQAKQALVKVSYNAEDLRAEVVKLEGLGKKGRGPRGAKIFEYAEYEPDTTGDRWAAYVVRRVGDTSLRDYLFTDTPTVDKYLQRLGVSLQKMYTATQRPKRQGTFAGEYLNSIEQNLTYLRDRGNFHSLKDGFAQGVTITRWARRVAPMRTVEELKTILLDKPACLEKVEPGVECVVHGDLHFENIRIDTTNVAGGVYWVIDPKSFVWNDYVYDLGKLLSSLSGHAHADKAEGSSEFKNIDWPEDRENVIAFDLWLSARQSEGWHRGLRTLEQVGSRIAMAVEARDAGDVAVARMKRRLLLATARHFFSAIRSFRSREAQWVLFARGAVFLDLFLQALTKGDAGVATWDPFIVCQGKDWFGTRQ